MRDRLAVVAFVVLLRAPFLNVAIQGDDGNYLGAAQYAQIDPWHPTRYRFVFQGDWVSMRGHPHPPLNVWFQAGLLALAGDIREPLFHGAYLAFSLLAGLAALSITRRFSAHPLLAALLTLSVPAFVIQGTSLESDLPFFAFWLLSVAWFLAGRALLASVAMALAAMTAFQAALLAPILGVWLWTERRSWRAGWMALAVIPGVLGSWQWFESSTGGGLPAQQLLTYFQQYGLQTLLNKTRNAVALSVHLVWMLFPATVLLALSWRRWLKWNFLTAWIVIFFAGALVLFFAGSARYLLPLSLPLALVVVQQSVRLAKVTMGFQLVLNLLLAFTNAQHWNAYRAAIARWQPHFEHRRVWINGEWGLRFYAESAGALPLVKGQAVRPGDFVVSSKLALPVAFTTGGGKLVTVEELPVRTFPPLCLIGLGSRSAYSTAARGFLPFDVCRGPVDTVTLEQVIERLPTLTYVPMAHPEADHHLVSGIDRLEDGRYRWMSKRGVLLLKGAGRAAPLEVNLYVPEQARGRRVVVTLDGRVIGQQMYDKPGVYKLVTAPVAHGEQAVLSIEVDQTFQVAGDQRTLGLILIGAGFAAVR
ncbi:MAG: hypothetical protein NZV14_09885 [Bryobacteraceae bacterium]|nr:hypothetical protein [Bryobacteraceae bacterium]MDW8378461.1 hypothetical protein [Bryobacterales bacterium]